MTKQFRSIVLGIFLSLTFLAPSLRADDLKEWTFLVYMNSDNNLYRYGQLNAAEMERVGSSPQVNIVLQMDPEPYGEPTRRYLIQRNPNAQPGKITSPVLEELGETDMGDWKTLAQFLVWGAQKFPAKHYAVVIWNHGAGWVGVSADDNPQHIMRIPELAKGLGALNQYLAATRGDQRIDIVNFDACLMSSLEVEYELRNQAKVLVGSQFLEPGEGEDYSTFLKALVLKPTMDAREFAKVMVYQYTYRYANSRNDSINYIAVDLDKITPFTANFEKVAEGFLGADGNTKSSLMREFRNPGDGGGFDLIGVMKNALKITSHIGAIAAPLDGLLQMYGYPDDKPMVSRTESGPVQTLQIVRATPGVVNYRHTSDMQWHSVQLQSTGEGMYQANIPTPGPGARMQYVVQRMSRFGEGVQQEAMSQVLRDGQDPIVYHDQFPVSSPVIADSHNVKTLGAHGISLYSLAGMQAERRGHGDLGEALLSEYKKLAFSISGAPAWTQFFGF